MVDGAAVRAAMKRLWPIVTRRRFVAELEEQGAAYRQNVALAEQGQRFAEWQLAEERRKFVEALDRIGGWRDAAGVTYQVDTFLDPTPTHLRMELVRDRRGRNLSFVFRISEALYRQMQNQLTPALMRHVLETAARGLAAEAVAADLAERARW